MVSPFDTLDRVASVAIEGAFGETVRLLPRREGKYSAGGADPARSIRECTAILTEDRGVQRMDGDGVGSNWGGELQLGAIRVSLAKGVPADMPVKGDHVQALSRDGQPLFEIIRVAPDNASRIVLHCARVTHP